MCSAVARVDAGDTVGRDGCDGMVAGPVVINDRLD